MTAELVRSGGCLCGAVRYEVRDEPSASGLCHCAVCRKLTGSAFSATANWRRSQFQMVGELQTFERRSLCPTCGSRLFFLSDEDIEVFLGTLDSAPNDIKPTVEVWVARREHWLREVPETTLHDRRGWDVPAGGGRTIRRSARAGPSSVVWMAPSAPPAARSARPASRSPPSPPHGASPLCGGSHSGRTGWRAPRCPRSATPRQHVPWAPFSASSDAAPEPGTPSARRCQASP